MEGEKNRKFQKATSDRDLRECSGSVFRKERTNIRYIKEAEILGLVY